MTTAIDQQDANLLVEEPKKYTFDEIVELVSSIQEQVASLDYRVTNKNFGSKIYQAKETIASKSRFIAGAKDDVVILDGQHPTYRIWAGSTDPETAPFSVDKFGNMIATSLDLSGYLQVGGALGDVQSVIGDLSDIDTDLGVITAGTLIGLTVIGGEVKTSSSGARVVMDGVNDQLAIYDTSRKRMYLDSDELVFINSSGSATAHLTASSYALDIDTTGGAWSGWTFNASYGVYFISGTTPVALFNNNGLTMQNAKSITGTGDILSSSNGVYDLGSSSNYWNRVYTQDLYFEGAGSDIFYPQRILWTGSTANPSGDGTMVYYDSGGTEGLRMQFGSSDFQFDATGV